VRLFEALNDEIKNESNGTYAPYYFRALGFRQEFDAPPPLFRANGIHALFTRHTPVILKNEWFAGNLKGMYTEQEPLVLSHAEKTVKSFGVRSFTTNKDHFAPDYRRLLADGLPATLQAIDRSLQEHKEKERQETLRGMKRAMEGFCQMIARYGEAAESLQGDPAYNAARLAFISRNCRALLAGRPQHLGEALQLVWFCHVAFLMEGRYAMALGRLDQYLYPFYQADLQAGLVTEAQVVEWLENLFIRLQDDVVNICIGGRQPNGDCAINGLSRCILRAVGNCNVPGPNLSLRLTEKAVREDLFSRNHPVYTKVRDRVPTFYGEDCHIENCTVADGCMLGGTAKNSILFRQVTLYPGAEVENCVIMNDTVIGEGAQLKYVILDKDVVVRPGAKLMGTPATPVIIGRGEVV
jgi:hypothetical protein